ncbi:MAG: Gfo/Idh/MocA family oxidoreductase, partial [Blastochloris sp.]|nr:Gfo/Idh/MocA family oxidoreductase [Blastochloris sp.]
MATEQQLRVGLVGLGWAGETALRAFRALPGTTIVGLSDPRVERMAELQAQYKVTDAYTDY